MPEKLDLISMGDLMIDFSCIGKSRAGQLIFERNPGGAPMNVASQLKKAWRNSWNYQLCRKR